MFPAPEFLRHPLLLNIVTHTHFFLKLDQVLLSFCYLEPKTTENKNQNYYNKNCNKANCSVGIIHHKMLTFLYYQFSQQRTHTQKKIRHPIINGYTHPSKGLVHDPYFMN